MTEMGITFRTTNFRSNAPKTRIYDFLHMSPIQRLKKARPTATSIELRIRLEEFRLTTNAAIGPHIRARVVLAGKGGFGPSLASNVELLGGQFRPPLLLGLVLLVSQGSAR